MVENSTAGLVMVGGDAAVTVTREEDHQSAFARYAPAPGGERRVAVELAWCRIGSGKYKGQRAIEIRLDGRRVGELTYLMSQRYAPLVTRVNAHNGRAGCEAVIVREAKGLQLTLRLPRDPDAVPMPPAPRAFVPDAPTVVIPPVRHAPAPAAAAESTFTKHKTVWLVGAAAIVVVLFAAIIGNNADDPSPSAASQTTTETTTTTEAPPPPTTTPTTTTTTPPPPPPTTTTVVQPPAPPATQEPAPPPVTQQPPPQSQCDPNYSGCVPVASDVDCAGGSGNGPAYAEGPVNVIGSDIYGLDNDNDGVACE
jgi:hypothetical protein